MPSLEPGPEPHVAYEFVVVGTPCAECGPRTKGDHTHAIGHVAEGIGAGRRSWCGKEPNRLDWYFKLTGATNPESLDEVLMRGNCAACGAELRRRSVEV
jgi:hypothetical protein